MEKREEIAKHYAPQSDYFITQSKFPRVEGVLDPSEVPSTIGYTYAKFNRRDFEGEDKNILKRLKTLVDEKGNPKPGFEAEVAEIRSKILPGEECLGRLFSREGLYNKNDDGILIEFRTNSKELGSPNGTSDESAIWMVQSAAKVFKDRPDLFEEAHANVTYADLPHRKLYRKQYQMEVQTETTSLKEPITISNGKGDTLDWWVVDSSLQKWEAQLFNLRGFRVIEGLNQPHPFELHGFPEKRFAESFPRSTIAFDTEGNVTHATMNADTEVAPGVFATKRMDVQWSSKRLMSIHEISKPLSLEFEGMDFVLPTSSNVTFDNFIDYNFTVSSSGHMEPDPNARLLMDPRGFPRVRSGISWQEGIKIPQTDITAEWVNFDYKRSTISLRVKNTSDLGSGIVPRRDSELELQWQNGKWIWMQVRLDQDVVINGVECKPGWTLYRRTGPRRIDVVGGSMQFPKLITSIQDPH